jgi:RNA polymerase sigma-70 factor (ECF subfamily)
MLLGEFPIKINFYIRSFRKRILYVTFGILSRLYICKHSAEEEGILFMTEVEENKKVEGVMTIEELCREYWEPLYSFVYYKVQNREEAEDITQETFVKAISYIQENRTKVENIIGFLKTVALNVLRDRWRKYKRRGNTGNLDDISQGYAAVNDYSESTVQRDLILHALSKLNEKQKSCIELRILQGYTVPETAQMMGISEGNVRVLQYRALQRLSKILKSDDVD